MVKSKHSPNSLAASTLIMVILRRWLGTHKWKEEWVNGNSDPHTTAIISEGNNTPTSKHTQSYPVTLRHEVLEGGVTFK